jgi:ribonuclease HI
MRDPAGVVTELNGHEPATTNNRMELTAAVEGLRATERGAQVILRSDSKYLVDSMTRNYKRNKNHDLWERLDAEVAARNVNFQWVRGHSLDPINSRADELAVMGANRRLVADSASPGNQTRATAESKSDDSAAEAKLAALLAPGESIRKCTGCGATFVSVRDGGNYCSHARCQLQARRR